VCQWVQIWGERMDVSQELREAWVQAGLAEWERSIDVTTKEGCLAIEGYFRAINWAWALDRAGGNYSEQARRAHPATLEYCGIFWAAMGMRVGDFVPVPLSPALRIHQRVAEYVLPSTHRIEHAGHWAEVPQAERLKVDEMARGDIVLVETSGRKHYGDHYAMVLEVKEDKIKTLEANASGLLGSGKQGRGVVQRERPLQSIRRIRRFGEAHFV
jgi:hypothetical protein